MILGEIGNTGKELRKEINMKMQKSYEL